MAEDQRLLEAGRRLLRLWKTASLLITLGEHGMLLLQDGQPPYHTPTRAKDVFDVSGAGDTAIAVFTLALAAGATAGRSRRAGQPRQRNRGGQAGHRHRDARGASGQSHHDMNRAVFFDRDGTLMEEVHYCGDPAQVRVYPGVSEALRQLKAAGLRVFIVTNQSGIGRGLITEAQYHAVQEELLRQLGAGLIDASYFCPDRPDVPSTRRKPEPGMVLEAAAEFTIDLPRSYLVGDKAADIECGRRAGTRTMLVLTGYGREQSCEADFIAQDAAEAVRWVLARD